MERIAIVLKQQILHGELLSHFASFTISRFFNDNTKTQKVNGK